MLQHCGIRGCIVVYGGVMAYNGSHNRECSVVDLELH